MRPTKRLWREFLEFVLNEMEGFSEPLRTLLYEAVANIAAAELDHEQSVCCHLEYLEATGGTDHDQTLNDFVARRAAIGNAWRREWSN